MSSELALLNDNLIVGALLFGIGLIGFLSRRNMIVMFLAAEIMLQGVSLSLVAWSRYNNNFGGQMLVIFIIAIAACEAAIALAFVMALFQRSGQLDMADWHRLREENQPEFVDEPLPEEPEVEEKWPTLPPAGIAPELDPAKLDSRPDIGKPF